MATVERIVTEAGRMRGRALPAFLIIGWRWIGRSPAVAVAPVLLPFMFLFFLRLINTDPTLFALEIGGAMLFTMQNIGSWVLGDSAVWRIECSLQDLFVASPLGRIRYLFGIAFSNLIAMLPALVILGALLSYQAGVDHLYFNPVTVVIIVAALSVLWVLFSAIGIAVSSRVKTQRAIYPVGNLTFTILGILAPLYYPITYLPSLWQTVARFIPTTYAALLVQGALGIQLSGLPAPTPLQMAVYGGLLVLSAGVGIALALKLYRWRSD